jgi:hypothetical protein
MSRNKKKEKKERNPRYDPGQKTRFLKTRVLHWFYQIIKGTMHMTSGSTYSTFSTVLDTAGHKEKELRSHPLPCLQ